MFASGGRFRQKYEREHMMAIMAILCLSQLSPIDRGVAYLSAEVPRWRIEHNCRACHHQGDGARALYEARAAGIKVADDALVDATAWLTNPDAWDKNGAEGPFTDRRLARYQFASALTAAIRSKDVLSSPSLPIVVEKLLADQAVDGSWPVGETDILGSPVTRGRTLATILALEVLATTKSESVERAVAKAIRWLESRPLSSIIDVAAVLRVKKADPQAIERLQAGQSAKGGWGPYANSAPEIFDTAVVLWALSENPDHPQIRLMIEHGRGFLIRNQEKDGSWVETTRPSDSESLAQRVSTTAWALIALLATRETR